MKVLHYILTILMLLGLVACKDSRTDDLWEQGVLSDSLYVQLTLDLSNNSVTRANPNGGEQGDGWEFGSSNENSIYDFCLFVLDGYDIDDDASVRFAAVRYFNHDDVLTASTFPENINIKDVNKTVFSYVFNIAIPIGADVAEFIENETRLNQLRFYVAANVGNITSSVTTLGSLRDYTPVQSFTLGETIDKYSYFAMSNENDAIYYSGFGSLDSPVRLHVTIERLAARIDFKRENYSRISDDGKSLVYQLKKDATVLSELYLDELQIINGSIQPSYLIKRVADDINGTNLTYLGDETPTPNGIATNYVIDPYSAQKTSANRNNSTLLNTLFGTTLTPRFALDPTKDNQILGYVNENTFDRSCTFSEYTTGVQLKCRFVPLHNYYTSYNATTDVLPAPSVYELGTTFYMVEPNIPEIEESKRLYFLNEEDAIAYATNTAREHFCKVVKYEKGVCYYYVYMRHSNNVEVVHNTMEFGIVRNNIYRFSIDAATGPGTPTPDPRHPEELKARIYVKKWISVEHPIIYV